MAMVERLRITEAFGTGARRARGPKNSGLPDPASVVGSNRGPSITEIESPHLRSGSSLIARSDLI